MHNSPCRTPRAYDNAPRMSALGAIEVDTTQARPWYADVFKTVAETASGAITANRIAKENARRLAAGQPVLTDRETRSLAPTANVQFALPPEMKTVLWIGGGAIVLLTLAALSKRR